MNLLAGESGVHGVAIREMDTVTGPADYMLFIDGAACGIIEAKREGHALGHVDAQSQRYATSKVHFIERAAADGQPLPFLYEATNHEIRFRDSRDPQPRSRNVFHFHQPQTLKKLLEEETTLRARLHDLPELNTENLRACQIDAIHGIERSLKQAKPRALLQMATGSGKTYTAVTQVYRLAKFARIKRALFLVDRGNLGTNAKDEFEQFVIPHDGRKFTQHYNVNILGRAGIPDATKVTISTIQRMYSQLSGQELDDEADEHSGFEIEGSTISKEPRPVAYNASIPIEAFDVIIIDECHRSIYNLWRQVLEYFDAFLIGLTATPTKKTIGFFNQNLVSEYTHEDAVVDKVNVGYDIYRIKTEMTEKGNTLEAGTAVEIRDRLTKQKRLELLDEEEKWLANRLDRSVLAPNQIRTVMQAYKERCLKECFPERNWSGAKMEWVPKTLVFAKDDDHCDRIVDAVREVFDEGNAFCKKITYKIGKREAEEAIKAFRTDPQFRISVTVDMIATGTDIKALECVMFMRDVKSQAYYEQMKGRGTRVISIDELHKVTPDAPGKSRFVLVDCVGVTETDKTETRSLETKPSVSTAKLMQQVARGDRHSDTLRALGNRMIRLDLKLNEQQRKRVNEVIKETLGADKPLALVAGELIHATNEDKLIHAAQTETGKEAVTDREIQQAFKPAADELIKPFHNPDLRELLEELRKNTDQLIDDSPDTILPGTGYDVEKAAGLIKNWQQFIHDHKNELDAIQLIYQQPYQQRHLSYEQIEKLAEAIQQPPYNLAPIEVWKAYQQLEKNKVRGVPPRELLTNIVSLIRFSTGLSDVLEPFTELVNNRFENWLKQQALQRHSRAGGNPAHNRHSDAGESPAHNRHSGTVGNPAQNRHSRAGGNPAHNRHSDASDSPAHNRHSGAGGNPVNNRHSGAGRNPVDNNTAFSPDQLAWLHRIKDQIAQNAEMTVDDFNYIPFNQEGGLLKARELFGKELEPLINELNGYLIA
ncbi:MAG: DEAD/DEAH box helicase family protein [Gammaproteobacteria bacterium]|nr:DEAD/DEAH box helicase family protein [Gammaproteobacteria bacterium]